MFCLLVSEYVLFQRCFIITLVTGKWFLFSIWWATLHVIWQRGNWKDYITVLTNFHYISPPVVFHLLDSLHFWMCHNSQTTHLNFVVRGHHGLYTIATSRLSWKYYSVTSVMDKWFEPQAYSSLNIRVFSHRLASCYSHSQGLDLK